jgi:flavin reductase (DIM6/NTAB) family NADH-FMN oxidoreductase RutF
MATTLDVASKAVATACAHVSNLVTISSFNPLTVKPNNLFLLSLSKIGVSDSGTFSASLTETFPQFAQEIQQMTLTVDTSLALVVNFLESLLDAA